MTHFPVVVFTKTGTGEEVEELLAPYDEQGEFFRDGSFWDWWVIGGRWEGAMVNEPPITVERPCNICGATGKRLPVPDVGPGDVPCNGCEGTGKVTELAGSIFGSPPNYEEDLFRRNCMTPDKIHPDFVPQMFVTPDGEVHSAGD